MRDHLMPWLPSLPFCGFPGHVCVSVNAEVCHGVPSARRLGSGDLVKLDVAARKDGLLGDSCATFIVGGDAAAEPRVARLSAVAREALFLGILAAGANRTLGDIGHAVHRHAEVEGFRVVTEFGGHGVGERFHEPPRVLHVGKPGHGHQLVEGQVFTIEPMLAEGSGLTTVRRDGWTVVTRDGRLSAQWEHTVVIEGAGVRVLTVRRGEELPARLADTARRAGLLAARYDGAFGRALEASAQRFLEQWPFGAGGVALQKDGDRAPGAAAEAGATGP